MIGRELYVILGVPETATQDEIKRAYRRRAKDCHPDRGGDPDDFDRLQQAFQTLHDPAARRRYDADGTYDDTQRDTEAHADMRVIMILGQIIENIVCGQPPEDITQIDVVERITINLREMEQKLLHAIAITEGRVERNKELTRRLRKKRRRADSQDLLRMVLRGQRTELRRVIVKQREDLSVHRRVVRVFQGYGYDWVRLLEQGMVWTINQPGTSGGSFFR